MESEKLISMKTYHTGKRKFLDFIGKFITNILYDNLVLIERLYELIK